MIVQYLTSCARFGIEGIQKSAKEIRQSLKWEREKTVLGGRAMELKKRRR